MIDAAALPPQLAREHCGVLGGQPLLIADCSDAAAWRFLDRLGSRRSAVAIGLSDSGSAPAPGALLFDILLTTGKAETKHWVEVRRDELQALLGDISAAVGRMPVASSILAQSLRIGAKLDMDDALSVESLAYSTLLGGEEFRRWRSARPPKNRAPTEGAFVHVERQGRRLSLVLNRPAVRNALCIAMRDQLLDALSIAEIDTELQSIELSGAGPVFCAGGDLNEFGGANDKAMAHIVRTTRSVAGLMAALSARTTARVHGRCAGAGVEMAAAAGRVLASADAQFFLPELSMGLMPGAGGTVSISRRIGRWRTAFLAISGRSIGAATALDWRLVDGVADAA